MSPPKRNVTSSGKSSTKSESAAAGDLSCTKEVSAKPTVPSVPQLISVVERELKGFPWRVKVRREVSPHKLLAFLVTKLLLTDASGGLSFEETLAAIECYHVLKEKSVKDKGYAEKHLTGLRLVEEVLRTALDPETFPLQLRWSRKMEDDDFSELGAYYIGRRNYGSQSGQYLWKTAFRVIYANLEKPIYFPPKRWMGVGHRDSGLLRDPGYDGSPSWQETFKCLTPLSELQDELMDVDTN